MKNNFYHWLYPLFTALLILAVVWYFPDPVTFKYMPDNPTFRLYSLLMAIILCYVLYIPNRIVFRYITDRKRKMKTGVEYAIILFFIILAITAGSLFFTFFINHQHFSWTELIKNWGLITPIGFISYLFRRNLRMKDEYNRQALQLEKTKTNQLETELKYLQAQYHPHFLFNALNTIYFQIDDRNDNAKVTVELLSELLRYQLYDLAEKVDISKEINFIKSYIKFQKLRKTKQLATKTSFDDALDKQKIFPLIYQPFLENAFKYVGGENRITLEMKLEGNQIIFRIENSLPEQMPLTKESSAGIGIENIKRRLALLYPEHHRLAMKQSEKSFYIELIITPDSNDN